MNSEEIILEQYKTYSAQKDCFVDRNFKTNKFYLLIIFAVVLALCFTKDYSFVYGITATLIFSITGMTICVLWWINVDSYNFLIKVKLSKVLEEIEKKLPVQPYQIEIAAINDLRKSKREFLFADIQKALAVLAFLLFFVIASNEILIMLFT